MSSNKVLIVSSPKDAHCYAVSHWLRKDELAEPIVFDFHDFPVRAAMTFQSGLKSSLRLPGVGTLRMEEIAGVWWRRPQSFSFAETISDPKVEQFCEVNCRHAIQGFFGILGERVVDPLFRVEAASRKLVQLHLAQNCNLQIPPTCVTNDPETAREFVESQDGRVIYKIFRGGGSYYTGTKLLDHADLNMFHSLHHSPVIFQKYIEPGFDIRVTVVGKDIFAAKLISEKKDAQVDIRNDVSCEIEPYQLPQDVEHRIQKLITILGLRFAAVDLRSNRIGEHYFLEVNPNGQYLFIETATNQPITAALARLLAEPCGKNSQP